MKSIKTLTKQIIAFRNSRDWEQFHNPKDMAISLVLEAVEVMEHFQWRNKDEMEKYVIEKKDEIGEELADVLYWILLISHDLKIDILGVLEKKMKVNEAKYPVKQVKGTHKKYTELNQK